MGPIFSRGVAVSKLLTGGVGEKLSVVSKKLSLMICGVSGVLWVVVELCWVTGSFGGKIGESDWLEVVGVGVKSSGESHEVCVAFVFSAGGNVP